MTEPGELQYITISTRSHLAHVATLAESLARHEPGTRLTCYLVERAPAPEDSFDGLFEILPVSELALPGGLRFLFQYTPFALCCALKPWAILDQMDRFGRAQVAYMDGDMYACAAFRELLAGLEPDAAVLSTPHLLVPRADMDFRYMSKAGAYNAGFILARAREEARNLLTWWQDRLSRDCYMDHLGGVLVDQRWFELAMAFFPGTAALRHTGFNVGHWNLHEYTFRREGRRLMVGPDTPLCLFHFSGFKNPGLTRHRTVLGAVPAEIAELANEYEHRLRYWRQLQTEPPPYSFGMFEDGTEIPEPARELVRQGRVQTEDPFASKPEIFAALEEVGVETVMEARQDIRVARLEQACEELRKRVDHAEQRLWEAENLLRRLWRHPVLGRLWKLWRACVNAELKIPWDETER